MLRSGGLAFVGNMLPLQVVRQLPKSSASRCWFAVVATGLLASVGVLYVVGDGAGSSQQIACR